MIGNSPAVMTPNTVIASATRYTARRKCERNRNRIADTSVPQWAMPTQNTKLVTYDAHMTGRVCPATPMPYTIWLRSARSPIARMVRSSRNTPHQILPGLLIMRRMSSLIDFCVTVGGTCSVDATSSGVMAGSYVMSFSPTAPSLRGVALELLEVGDAGLRVQVVERPVAPLAVRQLRHPRLRIHEVAEHDRLGRAALRAGGLDLTVPERAVLVARVALALEDALDAEGALLHDALRAHRDVGVELPVERLGEGERGLLGRGA